MINANESAKVWVRDRPDVKECAVSAIEVELLRSIFGADQVRDALSSPIQAPEEILGSRTRRAREQRETDPLAVP